VTCVIRAMNAKRFTVDNLEDENRVLKRTVRQQSFLRHFLGMNCLEHVADFADLRRRHMAESPSGKITNR
jgi:hypothetical protein